MMEGISAESASLAGHLGLDNLCWVYDNNHITIEGNTRIAFTEDIAARFLGYGWNVLRVGDANDIDRIQHALEVFRQTKGRPTFIIVRRRIICESFSAIYEWWRISLCSTIVCCRGLLPKTTVC
jgi:transketolase